MNRWLARCTFFRRRRGFTQGRRRAEARRAARRGFTLIEVMLASAIFGMVLTALVWLAVSAARLVGVNDNSASLQAQTRVQLDTFIQDVHDSSAVLSSFTAGTTTYNSQTNNTLILQAPAYTYDSSGNVQNSYTDTIIYHLVGASAPYTLNRLVVPQSGSPRPASADTVIVQNVQSATLTCLVTTTWTGDGSKAIFDLPPAVAGSGANLVMSVVANGAAVGLGSDAGQAQFMQPTTNPNKPNGTLQFTTAPAAGATIDALYSADPSVAANQAAITGVTLDLTVSTTNPGLAPSTTQTVEMTSTSELRNH